MTKNSLKSVSLMTLMAQRFVLLRNLRPSKCPSLRRGYGAMGGATRLLCAIFSNGVGTGLIVHVHDWSVIKK